MMRERINISILKQVLSFEIKPRDDGYFDQFNRLCITKLLLACSMITGVSWFTDTINCIIPRSHDVNHHFVSSTCWIQGVYVYKELAKRVDEVAYFGIPKNVDNDGLYKNGQLCSTVVNVDMAKNPNCLPMEKTFYIQYHWMPYLIAALTIPYYVPYLLHRVVNNDVIILKKNVASDKYEGGEIARNLFRREHQETWNLVRVFLNVLIKGLYILSNIITFMSFDNILNGAYVDYGIKWIKWSRLNNTMAYDYMGLRDSPKPGNFLLPPFGYCEVYTSARDLMATTVNKHKFVCEMSQNILYQYTLLVIWFGIIFGLFISSLGFIYQIYYYTTGMSMRKYSEKMKKLVGLLSTREVEYLDVIREEDKLVYEEVIEELKTTVYKDHFEMYEYEFFSATPSL